jgi:potassium-transporting ATPase potassium-binding subunit
VTVAGWAQIALFLAVLSALVVPLVTYLARVFTRPPTALERRFIRPAPQDWKQYARSAIVFSGVCVLALYALLRTQGLHPFNPHGFHSGSWDVSFNTAVSFVSNTSWQYYAGETTLSAFSQMRGSPSTATSALPPASPSPPPSCAGSPRAAATSWAPSGSTCGARSRT